MKFSVVIPLFNKAAYIETTLESVLNQSLTDFEVVVVDDGSTDQGPDLVTSISQRDARVRLVRQANGGVSAARNTGVEKAEGEWVAFLDADDWWHPAHLHTLLLAITSFPEAHVVATMLRRIPDSSHWSALPWPALPADPKMELIHNLPKRWMESIPFCSSSVSVRARLLKAMQPCFVLGESRGEDLDLWFRLAESGPIVLALASLVAYRTDAQGSLTANQTHDTLAPFLLRMEQRAKTGVLPLDKRAGALWFVAQQRLTLARAALVAGQRAKAANWLFLARFAVASKRWLLTAAMVVFAPGAVVQRWERWRSKDVL